MEWYFCYGDGNCWANWFWSGSTAAWVQALLTIWVFRWSIKSTHQANERDQKRTRETFEHESSLQRRQAKESEKLAYSLFERERDLNREQANLATFKERRAEKERRFMNFVKARYISDRMVAKVRTVSVMIESGQPLSEISVKDAVEELTFENNLLRESLLLDFPDVEVLDLMCMQVVSINGWIGILKVLAKNPAIGRPEHFENALKSTLDYAEKIARVEARWRKELYAE